VTRGSGFSELREWSVTARQPNGDEGVCGLIGKKSGPPCPLRFHLVPPMSPSGFSDCSVLRGSGLSCSCGFPERGRGRPRSASRFAPVRQIRHQSLYHQSLYHQSLYHQSLYHQSLYHQSLYQQSPYHVMTGNRLLDFKTVLRPSFKGSCGDRAESGRSRPAIGSCRASTGTSARCHTKW